MMAPASLDPTTLSLALVGTTLCSASANTINQVMRIVVADLCLNNSQFTVTCQ